MSRLDHHVAAVRNKLALDLFVLALAWSMSVFAGMLCFAVLLNRIFLLAPPRPAYWLLGGSVAAAAIAFAIALSRRPTPATAAVAIDRKLGLHEKISSALYLRGVDDPFARAAVHDAENTAQSLVVNLHQHFPLRLPRATYLAVGLLAAAGLCYWLIDPMNLFDRRETVERQRAQQAKVEIARHNVDKALAAVSSIPKTEQNSEAIKIAKAELEAVRNNPTVDPATANRTAVKALQDANDSIKQQIKDSARYAQAQNQAQMMKSLQVPAEGQGPIADAQRAMAKGDFTSATDQLNKAVENFDKLDKQEQAKAAQQMQQLARQMQQMAQDPAQQQKAQQQLQQLGMNQQQAKQAQQLMQQAAQGDKQAMQQLQQQTQQMMQQMNNGQGPSPQQQQVAQQMMKQMQAQANAQQQAQQMSQAAQQMAQAMQQQAQQQSAQQQKQNGQQNQSGQQQNQQMNQAMASMQQQMQQMQALAQDAQEVSAAQASAQAAQGEAQDSMSGSQSGGQNGQGAYASNGDILGNGEKGQFNPNATRSGPNRGGIGIGDRTYKSQAPYTVKPEVSQSQDDDKGRILASSFLKDNKPFKGEATMTLQQVAQAAEEEKTDEVDQERVGREAQNAVKNYFNSMQSDGK